MIYKNLNAETLDFDKIGWSKLRSDRVIFNYYKAFFRKNYLVIFTDEQLWVIKCIIDDLLTNYKKQEDLKNTWRKVKKEKEKEKEMIDRFDKWIDKYKEMED